MNVRWLKKKKKYATEKASALPLPESYHGQLHFPK